MEEEGERARGGCKLRIGETWLSRIDGTFDGGPLPEGLLNPQHGELFHPEPLEQNRKKGFYSGPKAWADTTQAGRRPVMERKGERETGGRGSRKSGVTQVEYKKVGLCCAHIQ